MAKSAEVTNPVMFNVACNIRYTRYKLKILSKEIIEALDVSPFTYRSYETCAWMIPLKKLYVIADVLKVTPSSLVQEPSEEAKEFFKKKQSTDKLIIQKLIMEFTNDNMYLSSEEIAECLDVSLHAVRHTYRKFKCPKQKAKCRYPDYWE